MALADPMTTVAALFALASPNGWNASNTSSRTPTFSIKYDQAKSGLVSKGTTSGGDIVLFSQLRGPTTRIADQLDRENIPVVIEVITGAAKTSSTKRAHIHDMIEEVKRVVRVHHKNPGSTLSTPVTDYAWWNVVSTFYDSRHDKRRAIIDTELIPFVSY